MSAEKFRRLMEVKTELETLKAQTLVVNRRYNDELNSMNYELEQRLGEAGGAIMDDERHNLYDLYCLRLVRAMRARFVGLRALDARFQQCVKIVNDIDN